MAQFSTYFIIQKHSLKLYFTCYIIVSVYYTKHSTKCFRVCVAVTTASCSSCFLFYCCSATLYLDQVFCVFPQSLLQFQRQNFKFVIELSLPCHDSLFTTSLFAMWTELLKPFLNKPRIICRPLKYTSRQLSCESNLKLLIRTVMSMIIWENLENLKTQRRVLRIFVASDGYWNRTLKSTRQKHYYGATKPIKEQLLHCFAQVLHISFPGRWNIVYFHKIYLFI